jgi:hypothetical protein
MSSQSFANLANSEFNGNIILKNGYIQFPNGSQQTTAGGGGGNVSTTTINTYTNTSTNNFQAANITCATQSLGNNSAKVANTQFVQSSVETAGQYNNYNTLIGKNVNIDFNTVSYNSLFGSNVAPQLIGDGNSLFGYQSSTTLTTGESNSAIGCFTLLDSNGSYNTAVGFSAGENDFGLSSNNTYLGNSATQNNADNYSYNFLTLIGANSEPVEVGSDNQIVLGRLNGDDELFIPGNNIFLGNQNNISETYTIEASGENSTIIFTAQDSVPSGYQNVLSLSTSLSELTSGQITFNGDVTIPSPNNLIVNDIQLVNQGGDPGYTTNAVIYLNTTVASTEQLRVNINGTLYYINLTPV